jgi:hypothetical protein
VVAGQLTAPTLGSSTAIFSIVVLPLLVMAKL